MSWLRANYDQPVNIEKLAKPVNLSVTSFHRQFKAVTGMSPLQYQKLLRLQKARRIMLTAMLDAGQASRHAGYSIAIHSQVRPLLRECTDERHQSFTRTRPYDRKRLNPGSGSRPSPHSITRRTTSTPTPERTIK